LKVNGKVAVEPLPMNGPAIRVVELIVMMKLLG
jgi:hypothetical protein